jgi:hypothetical protein
MVWAALFAVARPVSPAALVTFVSNQSNNNNNNSHISIQLNDI